MVVKEIFRIYSGNRTWSYAGTLRNERRFNLGDNVCLAVDGNKLVRSTIVGVELLPKENPEYIYKVKLPSELVKQRMENKEDFHKGIGLDTVTVNCDRIFSSPQEAKESAIKALDNHYQVQREEINRYFKGWIDGEGN